MARKALLFESEKDMIAEVDRLLKEGREHFTDFEYERAQEVATRALQLCSAAEGHHEKKGGLRHMIGACLERQNKLTAAEEMYRANYEADSIMYGPCHQSTVESFLAIVHLFKCTVRYEEAETALEDMLERGKGELAPLLEGRLLRELSFIKCALSKPNEAMDSAKTAVAAFSGMQPTQDLIKAHATLSALHRERGQIGKAQEEAYTALRLARVHEMGATEALLSVGLADVGRGRWELATNVLERCRRLAVAEEGADSVMAMRCSVLLVECYFEEGMLNKAEEMVDAAMKLAMGAHQHDVFEHLVALEARTELMRRLSRFEEALAAAKQRTSLSRETPGLRCDGLTIALCASGVTLSMCGRFEEAERELEESLSVASSAPFSWNLERNAHQALGEHFLRRGMPAKAREHLEKASSIVERVFGSDHVAALQLMARRSLALLELGDTAAAVALADEALTCMETLYADGSCQVAHVLLCRARAHLAEGRFLDAKLMAANARASYSATFEGYRGQGRREGVQELVHCKVVMAAASMEMGHLEEADIVLKKALEMSRRLLDKVTGGRDNWWLPSILWLQGEVLLRKGDAASAIAALSQAKTAFEEVFGNYPSHAHHGRAAEALQRAIAMQGSATSNYIYREGGGMPNRKFTESYAVLGKATGEL